MAPGSEPPTPQAAAVAWVEAVMLRADLDAAWPATDPLLRLVLAQDWVWSHRHDPAIGHDRDWEDIAAGLAAAPPADPLWGRFAADLVSGWQRAWQGFDPHSWPVRSAPEVLGLDLEMVTFSDRAAGLSRRFVMRHTAEGWLLAGVNGDHVFEPGWPPKLRGAADQG